MCVLRYFSRGLTRQVFQTLRERVRRRVAPRVHLLEAEHILHVGRFRVARRIALVNKVLQKSALSKQKS